MGFAQNVTLLLVVLQLTGVIDWPWYVILSPMFLLIAVMLYAVYLEDKE